MGKDRVARPANKERAGGIKQVKTAIVEGPTATSQNLNPYNRNKK